MRGPSNGVYFVLAQASQTTLPNTVDMYPLEHGTHCIHPLLAQYVPGGHLTQVVFCVCPTYGDDVPAGHELQLKAPTNDEKVPALHARQGDPSCGPAALPIWHTEHDVVGGKELYPRSHLWQEVEDEMFE
mmetsp:Transcript_96953/g.141817  ORF Transcript_96953/g.141817 Transcript_96953/m.141817 type:complete len:130 (+) Transcript_96953:1806-2195(+)